MDELCKVKIMGSSGLQQWSLLMHILKSKVLGKTSSDPKIEIRSGLLALRDKIDCFLIEGRKHCSELYQLQLCSSIKYYNSKYSSGTKFKGELQGLDKIPKVQIKLSSHQKQEPKFLLLPFTWIGDGFSHPISKIPIRSSRFRQ